MDHHLVVLEDPIPTGAAIDAHAGLVRAHHAGAAQPGKNGGDIGIDVRLAPAERSVERALADPQAEQLAQQPAQPLVADRVHETQIHRQSHNADAERRARLQALGHRRQRRAATAPATRSIALHPRHHGRDLGQVDLVVAPMQNMVRLGQSRLAVRAPHRPGRDGLVRVLSPGFSHQKFCYDGLLARRDVMLDPS